MHALLDDESRRRYPAGRRSARPTRTPPARPPPRRPGSGDPRGSSGDSLRIPVVVATRIFGEVRGQVACRSARTGVAGRPTGVPGPARGRAADPPHPGTAARADRVARRQGAGRGSGRGPHVAGGGRVLDRGHRGAQRRRGRARGASTPAASPATPRSGATGLERALQTPGGGLPRRHAAGRPEGAGPVPPARRRRGCGPPSTAACRRPRSTALAGRLGGIAALDPRTGEVRALAGIAFSAPQPPGIDVQDRDHRRRAGEEQGQARTTGSRSRPRP